MKIEKLILVTISLLIVSIYFLGFLSLDEKLMTIFDEGYYYLTLLNAKNTTASVGISQWPYFITSALSEETLPDIFSLRIMRYSFRVFTFVSFAFISLLLFRNKNMKDIWAYFLIVCGMAYFSLGDMIITGNYMQEFFILMNILFFLLAHTHKKFIYFIVSGFFSFFPIIVIPPSGILVLLSEVLLLFVLYRNNWKQLILNYIYVFVGFISAIVFTHFFIVDLQTIYSNIFVGTKDLMGSNRGYGPLDHLLRLFFYIRDFFIQSSLLLGLFVISYLISKKTKPFIQWLIFGIGLVVFSLYVKKPQFQISTLWAFPFLLYVIEQWYKEKLSLQSIKFEKLQGLVINIFLFLLPLISVVGTNTPYAGKMLVFILPWSILFYQLFSVKDTEISYKKLVFMVVFIPLLITSIDLFQNNNYKKVFFKEGPVSHMKFDDLQYDYFQKVDSLFKVYNFEQNKDKVFATTFDHMTIVAFEAKPIGIFQLPEDFLIFNAKENLAIPKFIFMTAYDKDMLEKEFAKLDWGFPDSYDIHFVGSPDPSIHYKMDRWLYCKKK